MTCSAFRRRSAGRAGARPARAPRARRPARRRPACYTSAGRRARAGRRRRRRARQRAEVADLDVERLEHGVRALVEAVVGACEQEARGGRRGRRRRRDQRAQERVEPRVLGGESGSRRARPRPRAIAGSISVIASRPGGRRVQSVGAAVVRVAQALDEAALLEAVDQLDHHGAVDVEALDQLLLGERARRVDQRDQDAGVARVGAGLEARARRSRRRAGTRSAAGSPCSPGARSMPYS